MKKIKDIFREILRFFKLGGIVQLFIYSDLTENGWFKSFNSKQSIDKNGNPIPWNTYSYISFISERIGKDFNVYEYGGGNSTIWYAKYAAYVEAVEHDKGWVNYISKKMPANTKLNFRPLEKKEEYVNSISESGKKFEVIIVDGRFRNDCTKAAINYLAENGIIVFDNSDLEIYKDAMGLLNSRGFKKIDFIGMSPVTPHTNYTSIFYRNNNCINI